MRGHNKKQEQRESLLKARQLTSFFSGLENLSNNMQLTKKSNRGMRLKNITLVPYDLEFVDLRLITNIERKFIKRYHQKIYEFLQSRLSNEHKKYFVNNLINKI